MDDVSRLIITKELTELIDEIKTLSSEKGIEYGFTLFYNNCHMFPGQACSGNECGITMKISIPFLANIFGSFHTHPIRKKIKECYDRKKITEEQMGLAINRNQSGASIIDLLTSIEDLFLRGNITDSAVLVMSDVDINNYISIYIPKRFIPTNKFKDVIEKIQNSPEPEYKKICDITIAPKEEVIYNYVLDLFYNFKFSVPSNKDIVIERNNKTAEYNLIS